MNTTWEDFQNGYNNASSRVRELIDSDVIPTLVDQMSVNDPGVQINDVLAIKLLSHFILGNISETDLKKELNLADEALRPVLAELQRQQSGSPKERLELRPEGQPKPLTREEVLAALAPRRTMGEDIESLRQQEEGDGNQK